jgi:hypothetical protein
MDRPPQAGHRGRLSHAARPLITTMPAPFAQPTASAGGLR